MAVRGSPLALRPTALLQTLATVLVAVVATAGTAHAAGSSRLTLGLTDYGYLGSANPAVFDPWISRAVAEHPSIVRVGVAWSAVAPPSRPSKGFDQRDPGSPFYSWQGVDAVVRNLAARGFRILIVITGAPRWAEGAHRPRGAPAGTWEPSAQAFGRFARAAATRYSGRFPDPLNPGRFLPGVRLWEAWSEPNLSEYLTPQWRRAGQHRYVAVSPSTYRRLLNAFYAAVKGVSTANVVIGGGTSPFGDLTPTSGFRARMPPVTFDQDLLCLQGQNLTAARCAHHAHMDVLDHHPYDISGPFAHALDPGDVSVPDMGKLIRLVRAARRDRTLLPRAGRGIWVTELGWVSDPPEKRGPPVQLQARWLEQGLYLLWRQGVGTVCWLQLGDDRSKSGLGAGLYYADGRPKPAAQAFRFPFVVVANEHHRARVWGRSPLAGIVQIERRARGRWVTLKRMKVDRYGIFSATVTVVGHPTLRAQISNQASLSWAKA